MEPKVVLPYAPILVESTRSIGYSGEASDDAFQDKGKEPADLAALAKLLTNPETADLLKQLMTAMGK